MRYLRKGIVMFGLVGLILVVGTVQHAMGAGNVEAGGKLYQTRCSPAMVLMVKLQRRQHRH